MSFTSVSFFRLQKAQTPYVGLYENFEISLVVRLDLWQLWRDVTTHAYVVDVIRLMGIWNFLTSEVWDGL